MLRVRQVWQLLEHDWHILPLRIIIPVGQLLTQLDPYRYRKGIHDRQEEALMLQVKQSEELQAIQSVPFE